jgi:hypothetical protein
MAASNVLLWKRIVAIPTHTAVFTRAKIACRVLEIQSPIADRIDRETAGMGMGRVLLIYSCIYLITY